MALIVKCHKCLKRIPETETACPFCGGVDFRFIIDYWPRGRHGGRRHLSLPENTRTVEQARAFDQALRSTRTAKRTLSAGTSFNSTVADLFPEYLKWYKLHRAPSTCRDVNLSWEANLGPILGEYPVREIAGEHFSMYQQSRKAGLPVQEKIRKCRLGRVASNRTINKELDYFGGFLTWCRRMKRIEIGEIHYEKLPCNRPLPMVLSPEEMAAILTAAEAEPLYRTFFLCLYTLGFRFSEARFLRPADFDFANRSVRVRQKGGTWKILPLNDQIIEAVRTLVEENSRKKGQSGGDRSALISRHPSKVEDNGRKQGQSGAIASEIQLDLGGKVEDYLFANPRTGEPIGDIRAAIKRTCKAAGVTKRVTPHLFRHSVSSHLMNNNVNVSIIQKFLGHASITTTQWYSHVSMDNLRAAQSLLQNNP